MLSPVRDRHGNEPAKIVKIVQSDADISFYQHYEEFGFGLARQELVGFAWKDTRHINLSRIKKLTVGLKRIVFIVGWRNKEKLSPPSTSPVPAFQGSAACCRTGCRS